ncbi:ATP-dependent DNA helicase pfh1, partial [Anthophora retusa]
MARKNSTERVRQYRAKKKAISENAVGNCDADGNSEFGSRKAMTSAERSRRLRAKRKNEQNNEEVAADTHTNNKVKKTQSSNERVKRLRAKRKNQQTGCEPNEKRMKLSLTEENKTLPVKSKQQVAAEKAIDDEFEKRFVRNKFGVSCNVCDRLWFENDIHPCPVKGLEILRYNFIDQHVESFTVCNTCHASLRCGRLPTMATTNGFVYPPIPAHLPPLDVISMRLISPRLPFMQIRLYITIVNVPVDVDQMVSSLPRMLDDDYAFNVNIKRHQIHKSSYLCGYVTKSVIKQWLQFLLETELYKMYNITVNKEFFEPFTAPSADEPHLTEEEKKLPLVEGLVEKENDDNEFLIAKQQTLMWSEDKYLDLAPSMKQPVLSLLYDEHAEELSFPSIYLGQARRFKINVTPYMIASSEIRRTDRRGVQPEHVLYMAAKVMRFRLRENIAQSFTASDNMKQVTKKDIEDAKFLQSCIEQNLSFLKSIPNSAQYWMSRKRDLFAMIRQLGKPTVFLTMSASEYSWPNLLRLLYRLKFGKEFNIEADPVTMMNSDLRTTLVNDDPVTCCIYFDKLIDTIMHLLQSSKHSPFGKYHILDYFKRIEFQQRGSPHAHILLWLENDPRESISESMPETIQLVDELCSVDPNYLYNPKLQTHKHTFTCYKKVVVDDEHKKCRFGAPFWPMVETKVLLPLPVSDTRREKLKKKYNEMHTSLEFEKFASFDEFLSKHNVQDYDHYLNILRAGITRPRLFVRRTIEQKFINNFNPWIAKKLQSNMDIQFILEEFSCATYVVEYVNKTNRGLSNLHRELIKLRDEYPEKDYTDLIKYLGTKILNSVEISSQEAAWYLLGLHMSESSRKVEYLPTTWPHERYLVRKTKEEMDKENLTDDSTAIWRDTIIEKYEKRPLELTGITLTEFAANWYKGVDGIYKRRKISKIIRYRSYLLSDIQNYKREMVILHVPFRNEYKELLEDDKYLEIYDKYESIILERRRTIESDLDIEAIMQECKKLIIEADEEPPKYKDENNIPTISKPQDDDFAQSIRNGTNDDIIMRNVERLPGVVRKRENVMTSEEFCIAMRAANGLQRKLLMEVIYRLYTSNSKPLHICFLTGPAGCGKTWLVKLMMEIFNRFSQEHNVMHNAFIATASTGMAAAAINGSTVHSIFKISNSATTQGLSVENLNLFRSVMRNVRAIFVDECSMIGSGLLNQINNRLQHIFQQYDKTFGGINMIFTGDLRQLPPVCQSPIYKRSRQNFCAEIVWQSLEYYPLEQVMRQSDIVFSTILTKIGDGERLNEQEKQLLESRFVTSEQASALAPDSIRLFFNTSDVQKYNLSVISGNDVLEYVANDHYTGTKSTEQLKNARLKVHKMKPEETGGLPYMLRLQLNRPYMIRSNIDVVDGIVNGVIGWLRYVECDPEDTTVVKRLWFEFENQRVGRLLRVKCKGFKSLNKELEDTWIPIAKRTSVIQLKSRIITCKRTQFPVVEACAITIHKSQGGTYQKVVYEYKKSHDQQLVYVALSRATSIDGLYLTNSENDYTFYHAKGRENQELRNKFRRLQRNRLKTVTDELCEFLANSLVSLCTFNVQSLNAHTIDLITDPLIVGSNLLLLNETWNDNNTHTDITGFRLINQFKRDYIRSGGVAIYENTELATRMDSTPHELYKYEDNEIKMLKTRHTDAGDMYMYSKSSYKWKRNISSSRICIA